MSRVFLVLLVTLISPSALAASAPSDCRDGARQLSLSRHMICMSFDMDDMFAALGQSGSAISAANRLSEVRRHAQQALALAPTRTQGMKAEDARVEILEYQLRFAEVYVAIARLEHRLLTRPDLGDSPGSDPVTAQLAMDLQQLIGKGHQRFR